MDIIFYYSKSSDKQVGCGVHESIQNKENYKELDNIKNWRQILSNFYIAPFKYKNKTYRSVEHAFQAEKISLVNDDKANWFCIESNHEIGLGDGLIARKNRKLVILNNATLKLWDENKSKIMQEIMYAKFSQNELPKNVLLLTNKAQLWHAAAREKPARQYELESVRTKLLLE
jgi:ribA/ribD-fused uncharacterized protein